MTVTILNDGTTDISGSGAAPDAFNLGLGTSVLSNTVINSAGAAGLPAQDVDIFSVTVGEGEVLSEVVLSNFESTDNVGFVGVVEGSTFPADALATGFDVSQLLGQTLFGTGSAADVNDNILVALGNGSGAIGFDGNAGLSAGTYTFLVQQVGGSIIDYTFDFTVNSLTGDAGSNILIGGAGDDVILGEGGNDILVGNDGNDLLAGGGGTDVIEGGAGIDTNSFQGIGFGVTATVAADGTGTAAYGQVDETFTGIENLTGSDNDDVLIATGAAANVLIGGDGNDLLAGGGGTDVIDGGAGIDTNSFQGIGFGVTATVAADGTGTAAYGQVDETFTGIENLAGSDNDDVLTATGVADNTLSGAAGDDTLNGGGGNDIINGGTGGDTIIGAIGADELNGDAGNDVISGGGGADIIDGGSANDTITGGNGADTIFGGAGNDTIDGQGFTDTIDGGAGSDTITGGGGADTILGGNAADFLFGNRGGDTLDGGNGNDALNGGASNDELRGGAGNDLLLGSTGNDDLYGDAGADTFQFRANHGTNDRIFDFEDGIDVIEFDINSVNDISDLTLTNVFAGVDIDYGTGSVRVLGLDAADFSNADFAFL
jgi:Ca2+-binding RTX toxin-like protein